MHRAEYSDYIGKPVRLQEGAGDFSKACKAAGEKPAAFVNFHGFPPHFTISTGEALPWPV